MPAKKRRKKKQKSSNVVHPNVSRVDYSGNHGYSVRLQRDGSETNKLFSDSVYGGARKAKAAAIAWREDMVRKLGPAARSSRGLKPPGYSYIKRALKQHGEKTFEAYIAFLRIENRKHLETKWSIDKWGPRKAHRGCEIWLEKKQAELAERLRKALGKKSTRPVAQPKEAKVARPAPKKPVSLPQPAASTKQLSFNVCSSCGGVVRLMKGPGREYAYKGGFVMVPDDIVTETCVGCGEIFLSDIEAEKLERRLASRPKSRTNRELQA